MSELVALAEGISETSVTVVLILGVMILLGIMRVMWTAWRADIDEHRKDMRRTTEVLEGFTVALNRANSR